MFSDRYFSRVPLLPLLAVLAVGTACSDSKGGPTEPPGAIPSGSMSFTYGGDIAGNFSVSGAPRNDQGEGGTWAAAAPDEDGSLAVYASKDRAGGRYDFAVVVVPTATPGAYPFSDECDDEVCAAVAVFFNLEKGENADFDHSCYLEEGMVNLQSTSGGRARGTFSGVGVCYSVDGEDLEVTDFEITGGSFDTAIVVDMS